MPLLSVCCLSEKGFVDVGPDCLASARSLSSFDNPLVAVWQMTESESEYQTILGEDHPLYGVLDEVSPGKRRTERLAVHAILETLYALTGDPRRTDSPRWIDHDADGRPILPGFHISVSHTDGYAVLMLSGSMPVGVDIEVRGKRALSVCRRFLLEDEERLLHPADNNSCSVPMPSPYDRATLFWSCKETLFKLLPAYPFSFSDYHILGGSWDGSGKLFCRQERVGRSVHVSYRISENFVLTAAGLSTFHVKRR